MDAKTRRPARFGPPAEASPEAAPADTAPVGPALPTETAIGRAADLPGPDEAPPPALVEAAAPVAAVAPVEATMRQAKSDAGAEAIAALTESQAALARGLEAVSAELMALVRTAVAITARSATGLLGARSWSDALALGADLTRAGFDAAAGGSVRLSELGTRLALDSAEPFVSRLGKLRAAGGPQQIG